MERCVLLARALAVWISWAAASYPTELSLLSLLSVGGWVVSLQHHGLERILGGAGSGTCPSCISWARASVGLGLGRIPPILLVGLDLGCIPPASGGLERIHLIRGAGLYPSCISWARAYPSYISACSWPD